MGSTDHTYIYKTDDLDEVRQAFKQSLPDGECDVQGEGNSYCGCPCQFSGAIGLWHSSPFATEAEAEEWVLDNTASREAAAAAAFYLPAKNGTSDAKKKRLHSKQDAERDKLAARITTELEKMLGAKSKTVTCSGCSSRLSRAHLTKSLRAAQLPAELRVANGGPTQAGSCGCPLCGTPLLSTSALKAISSGRARLVKACKASAEASRPKASKKVGYVVGGWAAE